MVFCLNVSGSYFQSAALALASLWGSNEILAALSGQGGIAVLISLVQLVLAIGAALGSNPRGGRDGEAGQGGDETPSMLAGVGLWLLGTFGAGLCWLAFRYLVQHPSYDKITVITITKRRDDETVSPSGGGDDSRTMRILSKNKLLYLAVALDFAVTLVRPLLALPLPSLRS